MTQNPFNICKTGWVGKSVFWSGTIWTTTPTFNPDGSPLVVGVARDISLWTFMLTVKAKYSDPDPAAIFKVDWQIGAGEGTNGVWSAEMSDAITENLNPGSTLVWDMATIIASTDEPIMLIGGTIAIQNTVTRRFVPVLS